MTVTDIRGTVHPSIADYTFLGSPDNFFFNVSCIRAQTKPEQEEN